MAWIALVLAVVDTCDGRVGAATVSEQGVARFGPLAAMAEICARGRSVSEH